MAGVARIAFPAAFFATLLGCANLYDRPDEISGNNTGGVIPQKLAAKSDTQSLATAHCARWGLAARITFPSSQTGGEVVFVCETPGQAPPASPEPEPVQPQPKSTSKKKAK